MSEKKELPEFLYTLTGEKVHPKQRTEDGWLAYSIYETRGPDGSDAEFIDGERPYFYEQLFSDPPTESLHEEVKKLREQVEKFKRYRSVASMELHRVQRELNEANNMAEWVLDLRAWKEHKEFYCLPAGGYYLPKHFQKREGVRITLQRGYRKRFGGNNELIHHTNITVVDADGYDTSSEVDAEAGVFTTLEEVMVEARKRVGPWVEQTITEDKKRGHLLKTLLTNFWGKDGKYREQLATEENLKYYVMFAAHTRSKLAAEKREQVEKARTELKKAEKELEEHYGEN